MSKKIGIEETMDVIIFLQKMAEEIVAAKKNDGKITMTEMITASMKNSPAAFSAFVGSSEIDKELADLDEEERKKLLEASMKIVQTLSKLFE